METLIGFIEQGVAYTGRNLTKRHGRPYLISSSYEINLLANSMQNRICLRYTTLLINCNRQAYGYNAVSRSTVNLAVKRLQPKITKKPKKKQGTKKGGKRKYARYRQVKQWLIMINRPPEDKK